MGSSFQKTDFSQTRTAGAVAFTAASTKLRSSKVG